MENLDQLYIFTETFMYQYILLGFFYFQRFVCLLSNTFRHKICASFWIDYLQSYLDFFLLEIIHYYYTGQVLICLYAGV